MQNYVEDAFHSLLKTVYDVSDEVVLLALQVLAQISSSNFHVKGNVFVARKIFSLPLTLEEYILVLILFLPPLVIYIMYNYS